jgi:hypothetical protein
MGLVGWVLTSLGKIEAFLEKIRNEAKDCDKAS